MFLCVLWRTSHLSIVYSCQWLSPSDCQNRNTHISSIRYFPAKPRFFIFCSPLTSPGSLTAQPALPILGEMWKNIKRRAELLSKHLESIHSQSGSRGGGRHEKKRGIKEPEGDSERETHQREQPFSCSSSSSTGQGSWKRGDYQGTGSVLATAASALSCTARYTAQLKRRTWFSHTNTQARAMASWLLFAKKHAHGILAEPWKTDSDTFGCVHVWRLILKYQPMNTDMSDTLMGPGVGKYV